MSETPGGPDVSAPRFCQACGTDRAIIFQRAKEMLLAADREQIAAKISMGLEIDDPVRAHKFLSNLRDSLADGRLPGSPPRKESRSHE